MCGIVGLANTANHPFLSRMNELILHRGPDDQGEYFDAENGVSMAMRRLSIIDLERGGQPMTNEDESLVVVCNGEIFNSPELREQLINKGHSFKTINADVEVLLHLYEDKGPDLLQDLNGMFAFVVYDKNKNLLFGARDRMGIKPFYYSHKSRRFAFASEFKSLLVLPWISRDICFNSLYHYISLQFVPAPESIFTDVKKLPAGHFFLYDVNKTELEVECYWDLRFKPDNRYSISDWKEILYKKLKEALNRWTLSDVPIACSLSGGLDSSALVGLLAKSGRRDIGTYSLGFEGNDQTNYNELPLARKVAKKWGTKHHELVLNPEQLLNDLEKMVWHLDEPYGGGLPSWYIFEFIGRDFKVAITGTGGDELFGNYGKWHAHEKHRLYKLAKSSRDACKWLNIREISDGLKFPRGHFYHKYFSDAVKDQLVFKSVSTNVTRTEALLEMLWNEQNQKSARNATAYVDFHMQLPEEFLLMTDRFSMAHSVEARVPFLDHELVELAFTVPPQIRTKKGDYKYLLREVVRDLLPSELLSAPKKGFTLPLPMWTRRELRPLIQELLGPSYLKKQGIFSNKVWGNIINPHLQGKIDFTQKVWTLFMFQMWFSRYC